MTRTTDRTTFGGAADDVWVTESFSRYRFDAAASTARTDTPDLMRVFREEELLAEGYVEMRAEMDAVYADLAQASFESLPE